MLDKVFYYDRNGILRLTLNEWPYYTEPSDLKDWLWGYTEQFGQLGSFRRAKQEWELPIGIAGDGLSYRDALCNVFSADVLANEPGRLVLRDWSLQCYIVQANYEYGFYNTELDRKAIFRVRAIDSTWIREVTRTYSGIPGGSGTNVDLWRDYMRDGTPPPGRGYDYGYNMLESHSATIEMEGNSGNGYRITIYGPAIDPAVYINGHPIQVFIELDPGDRLLIVSNGGIKTITLIKANGYTINAFNHRDKEHTPFLTLGNYAELSFGRLRFDFTSIERRSEPTWI